MTKTTVVIGLQLDERDDALSGHIRVGGEHIPFRGWVGLVAALDRVLDHDGNDQEGDPQ